MTTTIDQALALASKENDKLTMEFGGKKYTSSEKVNKDEATSAPTLSISGSSGGKTYIVLCVDLDAPYQTVNLMSPIVHWIQASLNSSASGSLESQATPIIEWLAPTPPPLSGAHRYLFMLYEQPAAFDQAKWDEKYKGVSVMGRTRFDVDGFVSEAGLKDMVAATYFENA